MSSNAADAATPVWNLPELLGRVENDQDLLHEILDIFKADFPRTLQALNAAVAHGDLKEIVNLSHTLKGMLSNLAATRAAAASAKLEQLAVAGNGGAATAALNELQVETAALMTHLDAYLAEVQR